MGRRRNYLKNILCIVMLLFIGAILIGNLLAEKNELSAIDLDIPKHKLNSKLVEELNLSGETLAELVGDNPRLSDLREIKARVYKLLDFEWDFEQVDEILNFYEDNLKSQNWKVILRKIGEDKATLLILQEDGERKGLFILDLTEKDLTIVRLIGKFSIAAIEDLNSILKLGWTLETLHPFSRRVWEDEKKRQLEVETSPSKLRDYHGEPDVTIEELEEALFDARSKRRRDIPFITIAKLEQDILNGKATSKNYYHLGIAYERRMDYAKALKQYEVILEQYPNALDWILARALYGKGRCSEQLGMIDQAKESYAQFIEQFGVENRFEPAVEIGLIRLQKYGNAVMSRENENARDYYGIAENQIYNEKKLEKALESLNVIIRRYPESPYAVSAQFMKGITYNWFQKPNLQMVELLQFAAKNYPSPVAHYYLGRAYHERGMYEKAIEQFQALIDKYPDSNRWHLAIADFNIAKCLEFLDRTDEAVERYEGFIEKYKDNEEYDHLYTSAQIALEQLKRGQEQLPFLGVGLRIIEDKVAVTKVIYGSAAQEAGIRTNDVILSVDGEEVRYPKKVTAAVVRKKIGDEVKITIMRYGEELEISATLKAKPEVLEEASQLIDVIPPTPR